MKLEPVIGLEIHVQLKTKSKMFCSCANIFGDVQPNSAICPICLGYPGTLPVPNRQAIEWTQRAGAALGCTLASNSKFDRKSYFYPDLPKGYQISQFDQPFCQHGLVYITSQGENHTIGITRIHLEEDAAKNTHPPGADYTLVDYNRAGTPLMEIVTEPDIRSPQTARLFLQELQQTMRALRISDADMEKGQMRCDANVSLREAGSGKLHPKTEIKNVNSFRFVAKALAYEIARQTQLWQRGTVPPHATRGWDGKRSVTTAQRTKEEAADYRYFPEPDVPPFVFNDEYLNNIRRQVPELPQQKRIRFTSQYGLTANQANMLSSSEDLAHLFEDTVSELEQLDKEVVAVSTPAIPALVVLAAKVILREVRDITSSRQPAGRDLRISANDLAELVVLLHQGKINSGAVRPVLTEMQKTGGDPDPIIQRLGLEQESGRAMLDRYVQAAIAENPDVVAKVKDGKETAVQFLMGQVMAKSAGKANPRMIIKMLRDNLGLD